MACAGATDLARSIQAAHGHTWLAVTPAPIQSSLRCPRIVAPRVPDRSPSIVKILAIDCSTEMCSVALWIDGGVEQRLELAGQRHSDRLLPMVASLLEPAGVGLDQLDAIAVATGPGTFTGLRIAVSVAQGLAFGAGLPVIAVGTLDALALGAQASRVVACIDARMDQVYFGAFEIVDGLPEALIPVAVATPGQLPPLPAGGDWIGAGNGFERFAPRLAEAWPGLLRRLPEAVPEARHVAAIAACRMARGEMSAPDLVLPLYVRDRVALTTTER